MAHRETRRRWQSTMVTVDDILIEIVLRLPTKLQVQLKTVCQRWRFAATTSLCSTLTYWNNVIHWNYGLMGALMYFEIDKGMIGEGSEVLVMKFSLSRICLWNLVAVCISLSVVRGISCSKKFYGL